jgi:hypothetical protein
VGLAAMVATGLGVALLALELLLQPAVAATKIVATIVKIQLRQELCIKLPVALSASCV